MDFSFKEETILLKNNAGRYLKEKCPTSFVKDILKDEKGFSTSTWKEMAEMGWLGLIYDEQYGGIGGSFFDLFILFEEMGKVLLPSPFFYSAIFSGMLIREAGDANLKAEYLPAIIRGEKILTVGLLDERGRYDYEQPNLGAKESSDGSYAVEGTRILVPYAHIAHEILVCANVKGVKAEGPTLLKIHGQAEGQKKIPLDTLTGGRTFAVAYENVKVPAKSVIGAIGQGAIYLNKIIPQATILKCGEMLGGLERVVEMTVEYAKQRQQFGKPIGSFQVIQHYCVDMATFLETTRLITYQAASLLSEDIPCPKEIAMAKAWCSDAYKKSTWIAQQIHGGIGFTEEHDLHLFYKHAKALELEFGDSRIHRKKVAEEMGL